VEDYPLKNARHAAVVALCKMRDHGSWSNLVLDGFINELDMRERAFAVALFYGTLTRAITLDACIAAHSKMPLSKTDFAVRIVLRTAIYQILYMNSVPEHAAVTEAVACVRRMSKSSAAGFVNAVLRAFLRSGKVIPLPDGPPEKRLSVEYSCDEYFAKMLIDSYGEGDATAILADSLNPPPTFLRTNTLKTTDAELLAMLRERGVEANADDSLPHNIITWGQGALHSTPEFSRGLFHVQDRSSQMCALMLGAGPGERVLDVCAAPGGKSFTLAQMMENRGQLTCCDLHEFRVNLIEKRAAEMGIEIILTKVADMSIANSDLEYFDRVLCDVPCSGYGTMRRHPEIKYKSPDNFAGLPDIQYKILERSSNYCKDGGILLYSTCTLNPAENDGVADKFLENNKSFTQVSRQTTKPGEHGGDGFFMALLRKSGGDANEG